MRHGFIYATVLFALVALWIYQDRREIAWRAAGVRKLDPTLFGCAAILIATIVYTALLLWRYGTLLALLAGLLTPVALTLAALIVRSVLQTTAPRWFPDPP